jgi:hypothetical protein
MMSSDPATAMCSGTDIPRYGRRAHTEGGDDLRVPRAHRPSSPIPLSIPTSTRRLQEERSDGPRHARVHDRRRRALPPRRVAVARAEGAAAHGRRLLVAAPGARRRAAPARRLRRPGRRARRDVGRARHLRQRAVADRARGDVGRGADRAPRRAARVRVAPQGRRRAARADGQPAPHAVRRPPLRVLQRGPAAHRADRRRLRARRAGGRRRRHRQALRGQRLRDWSG